MDPPMPPHHRAQPDLETVSSMYVWFHSGFAGMDELEYDGRMPAENSSIEPDDDDEWGLTRPGERNGEGSDSLLPYLHNSLARKPQELPAPESSKAPGPAGAPSPGRKAGSA
jgi:hypothetical protein